jgi:hypothetical protein
MTQIPKDEIPEDNKAVILHDYYSRKYVVSELEVIGDQLQVIFHGQMPRNFRPSEDQQLHIYTDSRFVIAGSPGDSLTIPLNQVVKVERSGISKTKTGLQAGGLLLVGLVVGGLAIALIVALLALRSSCEDLADWAREQNE